MSDGATPPRPPAPWLPVFGQPALLRLDARGRPPEPGGGAPTTGRGKPPARRVALVNEGTYPLHPGGVSVWCDQIMRGLPSVRFQVVAICLNHRQEPIWDLPPNAELALLPIWDQVLESAENTGPAPARRLPALDALARLLTRQPAGGDEVGAFVDVVYQLVDAARDGELGPALQFPLLCQIFEEAFAASPWLRATHHGSMLDVARLAETFVHILRPLLFDLGPVDLVHLSSSGLPALVGLSMLRRRGTPFIVTEHGLFLRERYLELGRGPGRPAETAVLLRFYHLMVAGTYSRASVIAPVSRYNQRWQERVGAPPSNIEVIYSAVEPGDFPVRTTEPVWPTIAWLGRIDPIKDLHTLIRAAALVRDSMPDVQLRLFGSASPEHHGYLRSCHELVTELGLEGVVHFEGPVGSPADAFHAGSISALSSISEGFPYAVLESMACGVPVVGTDVGGVREAIGDAGRCVRAGDPVDLAAGCLQLLDDGDLRRELARTGRRRVETMFDRDAMLAAHDRLYTELTDLSRALGTAVGTPWGTASGAAADEHWQPDTEPALIDLRAEDHPGVVSRP